MDIDSENIFETLKEYPEFCSWIRKKIGERKLILFYRDEDTDTVVCISDIGSIYILQNCDDSDDEIKTMFEFIDTEHTFFTKKLECAVILDIMFDRLLSVKNWERIGPLNNSYIYFQNWLCSPLIFLFTI